MKNYKIYALALCATLTFAACDDDEEVTTLTDEQLSETENPGDSSSSLESTGFLITNAGNKSNSIDGDYTTYDYSTATSATGWFASVNGRSLGLTSNSSCIYGSKIYTAVTNSNTIEICDKATFSSTAQISLADNGTISQPRDVVSYQGYVYVSLYSGHVAKIDTTDYSIVGTVSVGAYPENMLVANDKLYVPNCNYGYGTTISEIDLTSFSLVRDITVPINPTKFDIDANGNVYLLTQGEYDASWNQIGAGVYLLDLDAETSTLVTYATLMDIPDGSNTLYVVNAPYGASEVTYGSVDLTDTSYTVTDLGLSADSPSAIGVDPVYGYIVLTSYNLGDYGYASYTTPGYANIYDSSCNLIETIETGVGPTAITFFVNTTD